MNCNGHGYCATTYNLGREACTQISSLSDILAGIDIGPDEITTGSSTGGDGVGR
jgi:hypothetical protein